MHPPLYAAFRDEVAATQAIQRLQTGGITRDAVHVFGPIQPSHVGSFADSGDHHDHTPERDHVGSFATVDHTLSALEDALTRLGLPADAALNG